MKSAHRFTRCRCFALLISTCVLANPALAQNSSYMLFDPPDSQLTTATGINQAGTVTGYYVDAKNKNHSFVRSADGVITEFDPPGFIHSFAYAINSSGMIAGSGTLRQGSSTSDHGFVRNSAGHFTLIDFPGAGFTQVQSMNDNGDVTGFYTFAGLYHGFVRDAAGNFVSFDIPAPSDAVFPFSINSAGVVVGYYTDTFLSDHAFVRDGANNVTIFDVLDSIPGTRAYAINSDGDVTGTYPIKKGGVTQCFVRHADGTIVPFNPSGEPLANNVAISINDSGVTAGTVSHHFGGRSGFLRDSSGKAILIKGPMGISTGIQAINNAGHFTGNLVEGHGIMHGFVH
jgi:uncharacterized membrane protein